MMTGPLIVVKAGGALLAGGDGVQQVGRAVAARRRKGERMLVVVSALRGVTDLLEQAARDVLEARSGGEIVRDVMLQLRALHEEAAMRADEAGPRIRVVLEDVERLLTGIRLTGELTGRTRAQLLAHGERLAAPIVAAAVVAAGADARAVTSEEAGLAATGAWGVGRADLAASARGLDGLCHELHDRVLVLTGFYGVDDAGDVVLFGRGGSDYTAGVVAAGLGAGGLELWKTVPGFMTADPLAVQGARLVPELSYDEACELGYYGARILHPRCLDPLRGLPIEVSLRSVDAVDSVGTRLVERHTGPKCRVAAITARREVALVRVRDAGMVNEPGVAARILAAVGGAGVNVDAVASSMTSVSFTIDEADLATARRSLQELCAADGTSVEARGGCALLGVVGDGVAADAAMGARMLQRLSDEHVVVDLISHGPGDVSVSCVVPGPDLDRGVVALHDAFFPAAALASSS